MKVQRAAVIGAGAMGSGIAQVLSQSGIEVILKDVKQEFVDRGLANIKRMYDSRVKKGALTQPEADQLLGMVKGSTDYEGFNNVDIVIEAALEEIEIKLQIFKDLDEVCPSRAILASNTSALSISEIASATRRPEKVVGMHFFNPAQFMKLVEVIPGVRTSQDTVQTAIELCRDMSKVAVRVKECPGFLVNRLLFPYMNEALWALTEGAGTPQEIDEAVEAFGLPMGPFALFDMTGIDICAHVNEFLYKEYGPRFTPSPLLKQMIKSGFLGQKSGAGFFVHEKGVVPKKGEPKKINPELQQMIEAARKEAGTDRKSSKQFEAYRVLLPMFNEAVYALQEGVIETSDVDVAMEWGCGLTRGLLTIAEEKGLVWCLEELDGYHKDLGERFRSSWLLRKLVRAGIHDFSKLEQQPVAAR
ncbi:MAG: hypothetical protein IAF58_06415 [Leptolyngbya sp.]|nr:hypothetical protein [Candidatus Melainabacteria bacterium]